MHTLADELHDLPPSLSAIIHGLANSGMKISALLKDGALAGILGANGAVNIQGEQQQKLDVMANEIIMESLKNCPSVRAFASEELDAPIHAHDGGGYLVLFDPLDGSSNIDINGMTGTIFSILKSHGDDTNFLQKGDAQIASGYLLYSSSTILTLCVNRKLLGQGDNAVLMFTLKDGQFYLTKDHIKIDPDTSEYAINASNRRFWLAPMRAYIDECVAGTRKDFNMRWVAAMVADVHRILCRGGVFAYPLDSKTKDKGGKLRLMYEANPMALIIETAGGGATDTTARILSIEPTDIHERVPVVLGAKNEVEYIKKLHEQPY